MYIRLESIDPARNRYRYYLVSVCLNLWGWVTVCRWGRIGDERPRGVRVLGAGDLDDAELAAAVVVERRLRRGYRVK